MKNLTKSFLGACGCFFYFLAMATFQQAAEVAMQSVARVEMQGSAAAEDNAVTSPARGRSSANVKVEA